jgi:hypothetical protein
MSSGMARVEHVEHVVRGGARRTLPDRPNGRRDALDRAFGEAA